MKTSDMDLLGARAQSIVDEVETKCAGLSEQEGWPLNSLLTTIGVLLLRSRTAPDKAPPRARIPDSDGLFHFPAG